MTLSAWRADGREVAVAGLGRSGIAATLLLRKEGIRVYASDAGDGADLRRAADELRTAGATVELGGHDHGRIAACQALVLSPGIPPDAAVVERARGAGVPVRAEVDVGLEALPGVPYVAVTGTNGKSTTTALTAHLLRADGRAAVAAGNIGVAVSAVVLADQRPDWMAVELSSFQLHDCTALRPAIGVLTNLSPDHLDRYPSLEAYYGDKARLFQHATDRSIWITESEGGRAVEGLLAGVPGRRLRVSVTGPADGWIDRGAGWLMLGDRRLLARSEFTLLGDHNLANGLMAALAAEAAGVPVSNLAEGLRSFRALTHRLEPVREVDGVLWINDSKATNIASTSVAVAALDRPFVLLLGGRHKGEPYTSLAPSLAGRCRSVVAYGEAAAIVEADLGPAVPVLVPPVLSGGFAAVVEAARALARPGDAVLLSPACSSFDMFRNYEERGTTFRSLVEAM